MMPIAMVNPDIDIPLLEVEETGHGNYVKLGDVQEWLKRWVII